MPAPDGPRNQPVRPPRPAVEELGIGLTDLLEAEVTLVVGGKGDDPEVELEIELKSGRKVTRPLHESFIDPKTRQLSLKQLATWLHLNEATAVEALVNSNAQAAAYLDKDRVADQLGIDGDDPLSKLPVTLRKGRRSGWTLHLKAPWVEMTRLPLGKVTALADDEKISDEPAVPLGASPISDEPALEDGDLDGSFQPAADDHGRPSRNGCANAILSHWLLTGGLVALLLVALTVFLLDGSDDEDPDGALSETVDETRDILEAALQDAVDVMLSEPRGRYTTEVLLTLPDDIAAQSEVDEVRLEGDGWYDLAAPAWGVTMDLRPFLEAQGPIGDLDADVTATWVNDTYYLTSEVLAAFSGGPDTLQAATIDELVLNEQLSATPIGALTLPLVTNPIGELLSIGATYEQREQAEATADEPLVIGRLPLIGAYGEVLRLGDRVPEGLDGRAVVHDTHVAQLGVDPDPALEDFEIEIGFRFDGDRIGLTTQFIDFEAAIPFLEDELDDAESLAGSSVKITNRFTDIGRAVDIPPAPGDAVDVPTAIQYTTEF